MSSEFYADRNPIAAVTEGMRVIDSTGKEIGAVAEVKMGDPASYLKVGHKGLFGKDRYATVRDIADVEEDIVFLRVPADQLAGSVH